MQESARDLGRRACKFGPELKCWEIERGLRVVPLDGVFHRPFYAHGTQLLSVTRKDLVLKDYGLPEIFMNKML